MIEIEGDFGSTQTLHSLPVRSSDDAVKVRRVRRNILNNTRLRGDGAIVMEDSGNILPPAVLEAHARLQVPENHRKAYKRHLRDQRRAAQEISAEQSYEMRSAFGKGETIVNAETGKTYQT